MKKITGYNFNKKCKPKFPWQCKKCNYIGTVEIFFDDDSILYRDVYKSCSATKHYRLEYIMVNSAEDGDYDSSITMDLLFIAYAERNLEGMPWLR